ncbi:leucine-rich_repeat domain-containing protein [Hexamita inflata]|uniref:Leucine-rich repeat domain-containing protein n=1 Tax=Hexamita inflata TaxID=28002 RepID=A0AA86PVA0_9EUKA|nr:leucine-rich repeat domain-containing protein [Hexamita inflata]
MLTSLTANKCALTNVVGLEQMKKLIYLNLADNAIVSIKELQNLKNLQQVILDNNFVQDLENLSNLQNYFQLLELNVNKQYEPDDNNYINYIKDTNLSRSLEDLKVQFEPKKNIMQQLSKIFATKNYQNTRNILIISKNDELQEIWFLDMIPKINKLYIDNCVNLRFYQTPTYIISLTVTESRLTNIIGLNNIKRLQYIDLRDNNIISIAPLKELVRLKTVLIDHNFILDLGILTELPNYRPDWIQVQNDAKDCDMNAYIRDTNLKITLDEFKASMLSSIKQQSDKLILTSVEDKNLMITYYKHQIQNQFNTIIKGEYICIRHICIKNDPTLYDLQFVEQLEVVGLEIHECKNVQLLRVPANLKLLIINDCDLKSIKGVERLTKLQYLSLSNNNLVNVDCLSNLNNLKELLLNKNKLINYYVAERCLKNKDHPCLDIYSDKIFFDNQSVPAQQEIDESM